MRHLLLLPNSFLLIPVGLCLCLCLFPRPCPCLHIMIPGHPHQYIIITPLLKSLRGTLTLSLTMPVLLYSPVVCRLLDMMLMGVTPSLTVRLRLAG